MTVPLWLISVCLIGFGFTLAVLYAEMARLRKRASIAVTEQLSALMFICQMLEDDTQPVIYETLLANIQAEIAELSEYVANPDAAYPLESVKEAVRDTTKTIQRMVAADVARLTHQKNVAEQALSQYRKDLVDAKARAVVR